MFFFFKSQMCSLNVVADLLCSSLKDDLCRLYLVLNEFSVSPIYVSSFFVSVCVTVALYITTHSVRQFPLSGQSSLFRQLQSFSVCDLSFLCSCSKRLLWFVIACLKFGRQL